MSKYHAVKTTVDNIVFDSTKEANRYSDLKLLVRAGTIHDLELQPVYPIVINGFKVCDVIPDFRYKALDGKTVVEDVKGMRTGAAYQMFKLKSKLVEAMYSVRIIEI